MGHHRGVHEELLVVYPDTQLPLTVSSAIESCRPSVSVKLDTGQPYVVTSVAPCVF